MAWRQLLHPHGVPSERLFSVAWSSGVFTVFWSFFLGIWILRYYPEMFDTEPWAIFVDAIGGRKYLVGVVILIGGTVGLAGLVFRKRTLSLLSCFIGIVWCAWIAAFQWVAPANVGAAFATMACSVFIHRFILLTGVPGNEDDVRYDQ